MTNVAKYNSLWTLLYIPISRDNGEEQLCADSALQPRGLPALARRIAAFCKISSCPSGSTGTTHLGWLIMSSSSLSNVSENSSAGADSGWSMDDVASPPGPTWNRVISSARSPEKIEHGHWTHVAQFHMPEITDDGQHNSTIFLPK